MPYCHCGRDCFMYTNASYSVVFFKCATCKYDLEISRTKTSGVKLRFRREARKKRCKYVSIVPMADLSAGQPSEAQRAD